MNDKKTDWNVLADAPSFAMAERVIHALISHKAENIVILDLRDSSDVCDVVVIATGYSEPQVTAMARAVIDEAFDAGEKPMSIEGLDRGNWALLDFVDMVVHIMKPASRAYYQLETLWNVAVRFHVPEDYFARPDVAKRHPDLPLVRLSLAKAGDEGTDQA
jgi:ribosome-associated protein